MYDKEDSHPSPEPVGFRHKALSYALQKDDIDLLILATKEELDALRRDAALMAKVKDGAHIVYTAWFWGHIRRESAQTGRPFVLPDVVRANLHWKPRRDDTSLATSYGII